MFLIRESMSSRARPRSLASARTVTCTTETPLREVDSIFSTSLFEAIFSSILRVTSCSTFSAGAPGQGVTATATRTGISGSLRFGIRRYPKVPATSVARRRTHATWGFSVK